MTNEVPRLTPYYETLGVTQPQYEIMKRFETLYWQAFSKPGFSAARDAFDKGFSKYELKQRDRCILNHTLLGSTPPKDNAPYVFDIEGKYQAWIPILEQLAKK